MDLASLFIFQNYIILWQFRNLTIQPDQLVRGRLKSFIELLNS